jgi:hypothetical protein
MSNTKPESDLVIETDIVSTITTETVATTATTEQQTVEPTDDDGTIMSTVIDIVKSEPVLNAIADAVASDTVSDVVSTITNAIPPLNDLPVEQILDNVAEKIKEQVNHEDSNDLVEVAGSAGEDAVVVKKKTGLLKNIAKLFRKLVAALTGRSKTK